MSGGCEADIMQDSADIARRLYLHAEHTTEYAELILDPDGTIVWGNATARHIFGYERDALVGLPISRLFTPEDVDRGIPSYELEVARASTDVDNDRWMLRADGSRFWAAGATTALRDDRGNLVGFGKLLRNRTDVKEQLKLLHNRLEALEEADRQKKVFLSTVSHELRNPLAPLANALQLIRMSEPDNQRLQYPVSIIQRQLDAIRRLVEDLLDMTRIGAGKIALDLEPTDVRQIIGRAAETAEPLVRQRSHRLTLHLVETPIVVRADPGRLEQVFVNLLSNSARYTPEGGEIEVRATVDRSEAIVHVVDNGIGIHKEMQPHIFELFTQAESAPEQSRHGLGLGLAIVKNLVELHGGSVQVRSDGPGKGSAFSVRLPLADAAKAPDS
jgi:PAS domain S-box-containing protein